MLICGQNMVLNPGFEDYRACPKKLSLFKTHLKYWTSGTHGTSDYFHRCSSKKVKIPNNFAGKQEPKEGEAYAGIYTYANQRKYGVSKDYREYISGELSDTLYAGEKYNISFYISLADKSGFATKDFGILFTDKPFYLRVQRAISYEDLEKHNNKFKFHYQYIVSEQYYTQGKRILLINGAIKMLRLQNTSIT